MTSMPDDQQYGRFSRLLESRMMGNYHVRFGGGPMEKGRELPRQRPTLLERSATA
jgi:hypothetical protein